MSVLLLAQHTLSTVLLFPQVVNTNYTTIGCSRISAVNLCQSISTYAYIHTHEHTCDSIAQYMCGIEINNTSHRTSHCM